MTGVLVLTIGAAHLAGAADPPGRRVTMALLGAGLPVASRQFVDQDEAALEAALRQAIEAYPVIVVVAGTGGELLRRALARVTGARLVLSERVLHALEEGYRRQDRAMPRRAERLALLPQGATLWAVDAGEPGWLLETAGAAIVVLPDGDPPLGALVDRHVLPYVRDRFAGKDAVLVRTLRTVGVSLADVEERLASFLGHEGEVAVAPMAVEDEVWVRIRARAAAPGLATEALARVEAEVLERLGLDCYGRDTDTLEQVVGALLLEQRLTLAIAESCTGGLLGHRITNVAGSSAYFERGVVVYSNRAKQELLGVPDQILRAHGAVSAQCAEAMAQGICATAGTACGLAITGIAGPEGGTPAKPVGTVFIGLVAPGRSGARRFRFRGGREAVKWQSTQMALDTLRRVLVAGPGP